QALLIITEKDDQAFDMEIHRRVSMIPRVQRLSLRQEETPQQTIAAFTASQFVGASVLGISEKKLSSLKTKIRKKGQTVKAVKGKKINVLAKRQSEAGTTENVAARREGSDKKDEIIVSSAHLDHIGISPAGQVSDGADDDGSGTVALLEIAEAFAK